MKNVRKVIATIIAISMFICSFQMISYANSAPSISETILQDGTIIESAVINIENTQFDFLRKTSPDGKTIVKVEENGNVYTQTGGNLYSRNVRNSRYCPYRKPVHHFSSSN